MNTETKTHPSTRPTVNLRGVIVPTDWDDIGNSTAVALAADDEQEYRISPENKTGRSLHQLLRMRVKIEGTVDSEAVDGHGKVILVNSYRILETPQP